MGGSRRRDLRLYDNNNNNGRDYATSGGLERGDLSRGICAQLCLFLIFLMSIIILLVSMFTLAATVYVEWSGREGDSSCFTFLLVMTLSVVTSLLLLFLVGISDSFKMSKSKQEQVNCIMTIVGIVLILFALVCLQLLTSYFCDDDKKQGGKKSKKKNLLTSASLLTKAEHDLLFGPNDEFDEDDEDAIPDFAVSVPISQRKYRRGS